MLCFARAALKAIKTPRSLSPGELETTVVNLVCGFFSFFAEVQRRVRVRAKAEALQITAILSLQLHNFSRPCQLVSQHHVDMYFNNKY